MSGSAHNALAYFLVPLQQFVRPLHKLTQNLFHNITDFKENLEGNAFSGMNKMI
jgi:hypothetical protein